MSPAKRKERIDVRELLPRRDDLQKAIDYVKKAVIFAQGDPADTVLYIERGKVKLTVDSHNGREAVIGILGPGDFFGEACLAGRDSRVCSASALAECSVLRIPKPFMTRLLHEVPAFAELFLAYLLSRNLRIEEDLVDQLFNSSEKRLARLLLLMANFGTDGDNEQVIPKVSQETLAEMIGTTRSRVSFFMNRFRRMGFITYDGEIRVHPSLLSVVLND